MRLKWSLHVQEQSILDAGQEGQRGLLPPSLSFLPLRLMENI